MPNFDLSALAIKGACPNNEVLYDDKGLPSIMVRIPQMTYAQAGLGSDATVMPAFIVNGRKVPEIYIGKFQANVENDRAYSLPGIACRNSVTLDQAIQYCSNKGKGWHVMTCAERAAVMRWCAVRSLTPKGNNDHGKHNTETFYTGIPTTFELNGRTRHIANGTGPVTYYHDQTLGGIADLCGNAWEWAGGIRSVYEELQILANNNAADTGNSQATLSSLWKAIRASDGALITPNGSGTTSGTIKMDWVKSKLTYSTAITDTARGLHGCAFSAITCTSAIGSAAKLLLQSIGMLPYSTTAEFSYNQTCFFDNSQAERCFLCGGFYGNTGYGFPSFNGSYPRSTSGSIVGFRVAYVKL